MALASHTPIAGRSPPDSAYGHNSAKPQQGAGHNWTQRTLDATALRLHFTARTRGTGPRAARRNQQP
eukprot:2862998-Alexandrium_andersonii.AAC.1